jgi:hypothetical protein
MANKVLARQVFIHKIKAERDWIAPRLHRWLKTRSNWALCRFDQPGNSEYTWRSEHTVDDLVHELLNYGDLDRQSTGKHGHKPGGFVGAKFAVLQVLEEFANLTEEELEVSADEFADASIRVFDELAFLYKLLDPHSSIDERESEVSEGEIKEALRRHRKRERRLRSEKVAVYMKDKEGHLPCEVCSFDFTDFYGEIGKNFAEVHHLKPLHDRTRPSKTKLSDLAVLCANCHRMAHSGRTAVRSLDELRKAVQAHGRFRPKEFESRR